MLITWIRNFPARLIRARTSTIFQTKRILFGLPAVLALILISITSSDTSNSTKPQQLHIKSTQSVSLAENPLEIFDLLSHSAGLKTENTTKHISHSTWVLADITKEVKETSATVEFKIFRPLHSRFWKVTSSNDGLVFTEIPSDRIQLSKSGFSVSIPNPADTSYLLGEFVANMPGKIQAHLWNEDSYESSKLIFERRGGILFGGILTLTAFCAILSIITKDYSFFLLSGWLLASLRVAAINGGWDAYWVSVKYDSEIYLLFLRLSLTAYGLLTATIFKELFISKKSNRLAYNTISCSQFAFIFLAFFSFNLDHFKFLEIFWILSGVSIAASSIHLICIVLRAPISSMTVYAIAWWGMIFGMLSEIAFQANVTATLLNINSQSAIIVSALIMSISLAHRFRDERRTRIESQAKHLSNLRKFRNNYKAMPIGLFSSDSLGRIQHYNPAFANLFDLRSNEPRKSTLNVKELLGESVFNSLLDLSQNGPENDIEVSVQTQTNSIRWFLLRVSKTFSTIEGSIQDITQKKNAEFELRNLVDHDHLTGLLNRRGLENRLHLASAGVGMGVDHAIAYLDIDRFKLVNDLHGFGVGDALLQQVGRRIDALSRARDSVARVADSFVLVLQDCSVPSAVQAMERVREAICNEAFEVDGKVLNVTVSIGIVALDASSGDYVDVMAAAGRACSEAKTRGRNCVVQLSEQDSMLQSHLHELRVVANLQQKIPTDRYFLEFQPIVSLRSPNASLSYEVLIRMRDEEGAVVPPSRFIGAAERHGLMSQIDRWVLRNTLEWLDANPVHRDRITFATLNLSGASLNDRRFIDDAFSLIENHRVSAAKLCFEITESVALHDIGSTRRFADRIRQSGSMLALDDFGAGYTSFNYLKEIPADFIKIDGSFVKDINLNPANYAITRTIVDLTHELGMRSIAEWAETHDTVASLLDLKVDFAQGFGLVRPVCPDLVLAADSCGSLITDTKVISLLSTGNTSKTSKSHVLF